MIVDPHTDATTALADSNEFSSLASSSVMTLAEADGVGSPGTESIVGRNLDRELSAAKAATLEDLKSIEAKAAIESHTATTRIPRPATTVGGRLVWGYIIAVVGFHLMLPLAFVPWLFSWTGLLMIPLGNYIFCSLGIGAGYHRLLTHRGFSCPKWFERTLALLGVCCLQDTPARWVAIHRLHHQHSDEQPDPHSPRVSWFWSHVGWLFIENKQLSRLATYERYARDVLQDPFYFRLERNLLWAWVYAAHAVLFYLVGMTIGWISTGEYMGGVQFGLSLLLWGVVFRTIYTWHVTWAVNSITHMWGYRNYETREDSRNNWIFALATNGEGWHNNHHAQPRAASHGHKWWELDITFLTICLLEKIGLVKDVVRPKRIGSAESTVEAETHHLNEQHEKQPKITEATEISHS